MYKIKSCIWPKPVTCRGADINSKIQILLYLKNITLYPCWCFGMLKEELLVIFWHSPECGVTVFTSRRPKLWRDCVNASLCTNSQTWVITSCKVSLCAINFWRTPDWNGEEHKGLAPTCYTTTLTTLLVPTLKQNLNSLHSNLSSDAAMTSSSRNRNIGNSSIICSRFLATDLTFCGGDISLKLSLQTIV